MKEEKYFVKKDTSILIFEILLECNFKGPILGGREKSETTKLSQLRSKKNLCLLVLNFLSLNTTFLKKAGKATGY